MLNEVKLLYDHPYKETEDVESLVDILEFFIVKFNYKLYINRLFDVILHPCDNNEFEIMWDDDKFVIYYNDDTKLIYSYSLEDDYFHISLYTIENFNYFKDNKLIVIMNLNMFNLCI